MSETKNCKQCGKAFKRKPSCVDRDWKKQRFCSQSCHGKSRITELEDRFWKNVQKADGCWLWTGAVDGYAPHQYGILSLGSGKGNRKAHRISFELANGPIPERALICHRCDNPLCVRPEHLFVGTQTDNMKDMAAKQRATYALTAEQEGLVRYLLSLGKTQKEVAALFFVTQQTISRVARRQRKGKQ